MSIQVTGNSRPGKPTLAVMVSATLLVLTLAAAAGLTYARNRPVALTPPQYVPEVPGLKIAWPQNWTQVRLTNRFGPAVVGVSRTGGPDVPNNTLYLLAERVSDTYVSPQYVAPLLLRSLARQLGFTAVVRELLVGPARLAGRPAQQIELVVYLRQRTFWAVLRVACEPNGQILGLLFLSDEPISPAANRLVDRVSESMEVGRPTGDVATVLASLGLRVRRADGNLDHLRGYVEEMPAAGPTRATFVASGTGADRAYAINVWTSWLANRRTLQDMADAWFRRTYLQGDPPNDKGWVQRSGSRIWRMTAGERSNGRDKLADTLYLRELPDRRVVWVRTIADAEADPEATALDLLSCILPDEKPGWSYDAAVASGASVLAAVATDPVAAYYRANSGKQDFVFTNVDGRQGGVGRYVLAIKEDGSLTRTEWLSIGPGGDTLKSEKTCLLRADLAAFQVKDVTMSGQEGSLQIDYGRNDAASPIGVRMHFGGSAAVESSFQTREPFLPDPAIEATAWYLAHRAGTTALFRTVGTDPQVPESILLTGLGKQRVDVAGRQIDAFACVVQEDTSGGPNLVLFDEQDKMIGYILPSGATFLRAVGATEDDSPAEPE